MIKDNQNPRASIGILCSFLPFFFVFEKVYKNLENVEFILDFTTLPIGIPYPEWYKERMRKYFTNQNVYFRDLEASNFTPAEFFSKYHTLVSGSFDGLMAHKCNQTKKKVRVMYGLAKDLNSFSLTNTHFDLVACPSEYVAKRMQDLCGVRVAVTGDPKYDRYILDASPTPPSIEEILKASQGKKIVLFAPTWGNLSSEKRILPVLVELSQKYTVFYKPHHMTMISQSEVIKDFDRISDIHIIWDDVSFMDMLKKVDVVITDNSSAIFDTIIVKKPLVLIDITVEGKFPYAKSPFYSFRGGKFGGVSTSLESLEQVVKVEGREIAPVVRLSKKLIEDTLPPLATAIEAAIESAGGLIYLERQKQVLNDYSGVIDGKAGERIASEIQYMVDNYVEDSKSALEPYVYDFQHKVREEDRDVFDWENQDRLDEQKILNIRRLPMVEKVKKIIELFY